MGADSGVMAGKDIGKLVMTIAIVALQAFRRAFEHFRRMPHEIYETPAVMQSFKLQIVVAKVSADRHQFLAPGLGLVESAVAGRIQVQSPGRLKQLRSRIYLFGECSRLLQRGFCLDGLRSLVKDERDTES